MPMRRIWPWPIIRLDYRAFHLCLHNISDPEGRAKACKETVRVLKPGGIALIAGILSTPGNMQPI